MIGRWRSEPDVEEPKPRSFDDYDLRLGDLMRGERATMGKSLLDVQRDLKIKAAYIAAIENADPAAFETPGFIAGYVRSYARYLDMDPDWAFQRFCEESGFVPSHGLSAGTAAAAASARADRVRVGDPLADPNASFVPRAESLLSGIEPGAVGSVAVLLALIAVIGYGGWAVLREIQQVQFAPVEQTAAVLDKLDDFSHDNAALAEATGGAGLNTPPALDNLDRLYRPQPLDVPVLVARDGPISTLAPGEVGALAQRAPEAPRAAPAGAQLAGQAAQADPVQVVAQARDEVAIFAVRPSWVRVRAADGSVIFEKILDAGEKFVLPDAQAAASLRSGNAGSVYFLVDGKVYGPAGSGASVVSGIELSANALTRSFSPADPSADRALAAHVAEVLPSR